MPRLRNSVTGVVVFVSSDTAARLGKEWLPAEKQVAEQPPADEAKAAPRARSRSRGTTND